VGTLLAGVAIGQLNIGVPAVVKYVFFDLFLFHHRIQSGTSVLPRLEERCVAASSHHARALHHLSARRVCRCKTPRLRHGVPRLVFFAGAFTESTVIGTASDADRAPVPIGRDKTSLTNNIPVAYAVTYSWDGIHRVVLPNIGPKLMRSILKEEARKTPREDRGFGELESH